MWTSVPLCCTVESLKVAKQNMWFKLPCHVIHKQTVIKLRGSRRTLVFLHKRSRYNAYGITPKWASNTCGGKNWFSTKISLHRVQRKAVHLFSHISFSVFGKFSVTVLKSNDDLILMQLAKLFFVQWGKYDVNTNMLFLKKISKQCISNEWDNMDQLLTGSTTKQWHKCFCTL